MRPLLPQSEGWVRAGGGGLRAESVRAERAAAGATTSTPPPPPAVPVREHVIPASGPPIFPTPCVQPPGVRGPASPCPPLHCTCERGTSCALVLNRARSSAGRALEERLFCLLAGGTGAGAGAGAEAGGGAAIDGASRPSAVPSVAVVDAATGHLGANSRLSKFRFLAEAAVAVSISAPVAAAAPRPSMTPSPPSPSTSAAAQPRRVVSAIVAVAAFVGSTIGEISIIARPCVCGRERKAHDRGMRLRGAGSIAGIMRSIDACRVDDAESGDSRAHARVACLPEEKQSSSAAMAHYSCISPGRNLLHGCEANSAWGGNKIADVPSSSWGTSTQA